MFSIFNYRRLRRDAVSASTRGILLMAVGKSHSVVPTPRVPLSVALMPGMVLSHRIANSFGSYSAHLRKIMMAAIKIGSTSAKIENANCATVTTSREATITSVSGIGSQPAINTGCVKAWFMRGIGTPFKGFSVKGYLL